MAFERALLFLIFTSALTVVRAADGTDAICNSTTGYDWVRVLVEMTGLQAIDLVCLHLDEELLATISVLCSCTVGRNL